MTPVTDAPGDGAAGVPLPSPPLTASSYQTPQNGLSPSFTPAPLSPSLASSHHQQGFNGYSNKNRNSNNDCNGNKGKKKNKRNSAAAGISPSSIALSPRPLQDLLTERAYLVNSLSAQGQRSCGLIQRLVAAEQALKAGEANGSNTCSINSIPNNTYNTYGIYNIYNTYNTSTNTSTNNSGGQRRRLRKQISLLKSKIAVAGEQEKAIIVRLGELYVEMQSMMRWAQVMMSAQFPPPLQHQQLHQQQQQQQQYSVTQPQLQSCQHPQDHQPAPPQFSYPGMQLDTMVAGVHGSYFPQMPEGPGLGGGHGGGGDGYPRSHIGSAYSCGGGSLHSVDISTGLSPMSPIFVPSSPGWPNSTADGPVLDTLSVPDTLAPPEALAMRVPCIVRSEMAP